MIPEAAVEENVPMEISGEAVEAAAKAIWGRDHEDLPWETIGQARQYEAMITARAALGVSAPYLMEQAWSEGWHAGAGWPQVEDNPYRTAK